MPVDRKAGLVITAMKIVTLATLSLGAVSHPPVQATGLDSSLGPATETNPSSATPKSAIPKKVMLRAGEVPHLTNFSQAYLAPGQGAAAHIHRDMAEVFFVSEGTGKIEIDGQPFPLCPGTCVLIEPGERHEVRNTGKTQLVLTYFGLQV